MAISYHLRRHRRLLRHRQVEEDPDCHHRRPVGSPSEALVVSCCHLHRFATHQEDHWGHQRHSHYLRHGCSQPLALAALLELQLSTAPLLLCLRPRALRSG